MFLKRSLSLFILCVVALLLGVGYTLEYIRQLNPCPLCLLQRFAYYLIGFFALIAVLHGSRGIWMKFYGFFMFLGSGIGIGLAGRQIWLQHLPADQVPPCGPSIQVLLTEYHIPLLEVLKRTLHGTGDCARVEWTFLNLSIAEWSLICFVGLAIISLYIMLARSQQS